MIHPSDISDLVIACRRASVCLDMVLTGSRKTEAVLARRRLASELLFLGWTRKRVSATLGLTRRGLEKTLEKCRYRPGR